MQARTRLLSHGKQDPLYLFSAWYKKFYLCCFLVSTLSHVLFCFFFWSVYLFTYGYLSTFKSIYL